MFSDELIKVLEWIASQLGIAIDWAATDVIPKLTEMLMRFATFKTLSNIIGMAICGLIIIVFIILLILAAKKNKNPQYDMSVEMGICVIIMIVAFVVCIHLGYQALMWHMVPEIKLFEYVQKLIAS